MSGRPPVTASGTLAVLSEVVAGLEFLPLCVDMSTTYFSFTFSTADPAPFGPLPRWWFGQEPVLVAALGQAWMTASRGDWLHFVLGRLRDRLGGDALDFLFADRHARPAG